MERPDGGGRRFESDRFQLSGSRKQADPLGSLSLRRPGTAARLRPVLPILDAALQARGGEVVHKRGLTFCRRSISISAGAKRRRRSGNRHLHVQRTSSQGGPNGPSWRAVEKLVNSPGSYPGDRRFKSDLRNHQRPEHPGRSPEPERGGSVWPGDQLALGPPKQSGAALLPAPKFEDMGERRSWRAAAVCNTVSEICQWVRSPPLPP